MTRLTRTRNRNLNGLQNEIDRVFDRFFPSHNGVLTIRVPKTEAVKPRQIEIQ